MGERIRTSHLAWRAPGDRTLLGRKKLPKKLKSAPNSFESKTPGQPSPELLTLESRVELIFCL
jgi:hypothetical protein